MNTLFIVVIVSVATLGVAAPSGLLGGVVLAGPRAILTPPTASAIISGPALAPAAIAAPILGSVAVAAAPLGIGAITNGGGTIAASGVGAAIRGPPTAPVVIAGPSGKIAADGLWGPTANIGLGGKIW